MLSFCSKNDVTITFLSENGHFLGRLCGPVSGNVLLRKRQYDSMADEGLPAEFVDGIRESIDCSLTFFGHPVSVGVMYAVLIGAILLLTGVYVLMSSARRQRR